MPQTPDDVGVNSNAKQGQSSEKASANKELVNLFTAAMAPFVGQMTKLNENVSLLLSGTIQSWSRTVKPPLPKQSKTLIMKEWIACLSAILDSKTTDKAAPRTGDAFLQELAQDLSVREQTSPQIHEGLAGIFDRFLSEKTNIHGPKTSQLENAEG